MALSYKNDEQADERLNPASLRDQEKTIGENSGTHDSIDGYDRDSDGLDDHPISAGIANGEENPSGFWKGKATADGEDKYVDMNNFQKALSVAKKRGGPLGLLAVFGVTGGIMASFLGPATMVINLMENFADTNDTSSTAMERRFIKAFGYASKKNGDPTCKSKKISCKMGRVSNKGLRKLEKKGLKACFGSGKKCTGKISKLPGYPKTSPTGYLIDGKYVKTQDLRGFLTQKENRKYARKVFGIGGAFNLKFRAWVGKYVTKKFYNKFNLKRNGGIADGKNNKKMSAKERAKEAIKKVRARLPAAPESSIRAKAAQLKTSITNRLNKAKKGGALYTTAVIGCLVVKIPRLVVVGVAAIQLAQILGVVMDTVLSPGGKAKASDATAEDLDTLGTVLTEKTPREGDGKMTSALDSPVLLSAMGVNDGKPAAPTDYVPGYSVLAVSAIRKGIAAEGVTKKSCDKILSPQAMYTALAFNAATSSNPIGFALNFLGGYVAFKIAEKLFGSKLEELFKKVFVHLAKNSKIPKVRGQALGDVLGIAAPAFFSSGGMTHHLPTLKKSQLASYNAVQQENEEFNREMDIAALSPFDTSSKYTFLGSMVHNMKTAVATSSVRNNGTTLGTMLLNMGGLPNYAFAGQTANATDLTDNACDYADEFGISSDIAINVAGMPCTGITSQQASMSTDTAVELVKKEGWLDESKSTSDGDTIQDLVESGYIKDDTPLRDYIDQCSNPDTGEYIVNSSSCVIDCFESCNNASGSTDYCYDTVNSENEAVRECASGSEGFQDYEGSVEGVKDPRSLTAIPVFLLDYQIIQSMNGEDEEEALSAAPPESSGSTFSGDIAWPMKKSLYDADKADWLGPHTATNSTGYTGTSWGVSWGEVGVSSKGPGIASDIGNPPTGEPVYAMLGGKVVSTNLCGSNDGIAIKSTVNGKNLFIAYMHGTGKEYSVGDTVEAGKQIMKLGAIGCSVYGAHVHIGIAYDGKYVCPQDVFKAMDAGDSIDWGVLAGKANTTCPGRI